MPSPDAEPVSGAVPEVHVERTADPRVVRWVCSAPSLTDVVAGRRQPPWQADSSLAAVTEVAVVDGSIVVRLPAAGDWQQLLGPVNDALITALRTRAHWLFVPIDPQRSDVGALTIDDVQRIVDSAAGPITGAHGGTITVVSLDDKTVTLQMSGACHGCRFTDDTVQRVVAPALRRLHPSLTLAIER